MATTLVLELPSLSFDCIGSAYATVAQFERLICRLRTCNNPLLWKRRQRPPVVPTVVTAPQHPPVKRTDFYDVVVDLDSCSDSDDSMVVLGHSPVQRGNCIIEDVGSFVFRAAWMVLDLFDRLFGLHKKSDRQGADVEAQLMQMQLSVIRSRARTDLGRERHMV